MSASKLNDVFLTHDELTAIRHLIVTDEDARQLATTTTLKPAQRAVDQSLIIPSPTDSKTPCSYDLQTGAPMRYNREESKHHVSVDGAPIVGPGYDATWAGITHNYNANDARRCALAAALFDNHAAGEHARQLLMHYADVYLSHVPGGKLSCTWGRIHCSGLEESVWIISMLWATELLDKLGMLSDDEIDTLQTNLFEPAVDLAWGEWFYIHNIRMWHNAAIGSIALAFNDRLARREAIHGQMGYRQQCVDGFHADGLLYEGSPGYHGYAMSAIIILAEAMARNGYEPYRDEHLKNMLLSPWRLMQPDGSVPPLNDYCPTTTLPTRLYGTALRRYDDEAIQSVAALAFEQWQNEGYGPNRTAADWNCSTGYFARQEVDWLLAWDKLQECRKPTRQPPTMVDMRQSGLGILRGEQGNYLLLKCSAKGSGHDHHDKLNLIWWHDNVCWLGDTGTTTNNTPLHENWFKHTLGHNSVTVDCTKQQRCDAKLVHIEPGLLIGSAAPYPDEMPDVQMTRRVQVTDDGTLHDRFDVSCDRQRTIDYAVHPLGEFCLPEGCRIEPAELRANDPAYAVMTNHRRLDFNQGTARVIWRQSSSTLEIDLSKLPAETEFWLAEGPVTPLDFNRLGTMMIVRQVVSRAILDIYYSVDRIENGCLNGRVERTATA